MTLKLKFHFHFFSFQVVSLILLGLAYSNLQVIYSKEHFGHFNHVSFSGFLLDAIILNETAADRVAWEKMTTTTYLCVHLMKCVWWVAGKVAFKSTSSRGWAAVWIIGLVKLLQCARKDHKHSELKINQHSSNEIKTILPQPTD